MGRSLTEDGLKSLVPVVPTVSPADSNIFKTDEEKKQMRKKDEKKRDGMRNRI